MPHNLFSERFYSLRQPAWHGLGNISQEEDTAVRAFEKAGRYEVTLVDLYREGGIPIPHRGIFREAVGESTGSLFGIVGPEYHLVSPDTVCEAWDRAVDRPVETLGALGEGETLFLSTKLPGFDVRGDEVNNYLLLVSPMTGAEAIRIRITPVRVVCQNTLIAAKSMSSEVFKVIHDQYAEVRLEKWLSTLIALSAERTVKLKEAFESFAAFKPKVTQVDRILENTFTIPNRPGLAADPETMAIREENWEANRKAAIRAREDVREIWGGKGVGQQIPVCVDTSWGLYNAVAERADYGSLSDSRLESRARDTLFGYRATEKERCFAAIEDEITISVGRAANRSRQKSEVGVA